MRGLRYWHHNSYNFKTKEFHVFFNLIKIQFASLKVEVYWKVTHLQSFIFIYKKKTELPNSRKKDFCAQAQVHFQLLWHALYRVERIIIVILIFTLFYFTCKCQYEVRHIWNLYSQINRYILTAMRMLAF